MVISNLLNVGGTEINTRLLAEEVSSLSNEVHIITLWRSKYPKTSIKIHGLPYTFQKLSSTTPYNERSAFVNYIYNILLVIYLFIETIIVVLREKIDIVHAHMVVPTGFPAVLACFLIRKPVIVSARGSDLNIFAQEPLFKPLARFVLTKADAIIALSMELKKRAIKFGIPANKVLVIPNGIDVSLFSGKSKNACRSKLNLKNNEKIILFVGTIGSYRKKIKGLHYLLIAMKEIIAYVPSARLVIVGTSPTKDLLEEIDTLGIGGYISIKGIIPHNKISNYYSACDVFVLPSLMEGLPTVILEAMASARPMVASDIGGCKDLIKDGVNGLLVPPANVSLLARKIIQIITDEELGARLGEMGRKIVKNRFTWRKIAKHTLLVYSSLLRRK